MAQIWNLTWGLYWYFQNSYFSLTWHQARKVTKQQTDVRKCPKAFRICYRRSEKLLLWCAQRLNWLLCKCLDWGEKSTKATEKNCEQADRNILNVALLISPPSSWTVVVGKDFSGGWSAGLSETSGTEHFQTRSTFIFGQQATDRYRQIQTGESSQGTEVINRSYYSKKTTQQFPSNVSISMITWLEMYSLRNVGLTEASAWTYAVSVHTETLCGGWF